MVPVRLKCQAHGLFTRLSFTMLVIPLCTIMTRAGQAMAIDDALFATAEELMFVHDMMASQQQQQLHRDSNLHHRINTHEILMGLDGQVIFTHFFNFKLFNVLFLS
jgi:hypothetical protein